MSNVMDELCNAAVDGHFTKVFLAKCQNELDRIIGTFVRFIIKLRTSTVENKVFFYTQENKYCCNPKYISEEFRRQGHDDIEVVWKGRKNDSDNVPKEFKKVAFNTVDYFKELYSSKIVITNSNLFLNVPVKLKNNQILLQTWHGSLGIKKYGEKDIKDNWRRPLALKQTARMTNYCISNSNLENHSFRDTYWPHTPIVEYGHARNDIFFEKYAEERKRLKDQLCKTFNLPIETHIIMYAPTFRDDKSTRYYDIDLQRLINTIRARWGGEWCLFLRYHPSLAKLIKVNDEELSMQSIYNVTNYPDMQELAAVTDIAITDYSSWIYDFLLMKKPGFIYAADLDSYDNERGFYYPIETTPFPIATNNDELMNNIKSFDEEKYLNEVNEFLIEKGCVDDGKAAERAVKLIRNLLDGKTPDDAIYELEK